MTACSNARKSNAESGARATGDATQDGSGTSLVVTDAAVSGNTPALDATTTLSVRLATSAERVCPGECVTVTAKLDTADTGYEYRWSDSSWHGAGPHRVCPSASTPISVSVRDGAGSDATPSGVELGQAHVTLQLSDAGCANSLGIESEDASSSDAAAELARDVCPTQLDVLDGWIGSRTAYGANQRAVIDTQGNLVLVAAYTGAVQHDGEMLLPRAGGGVLIAKFNSGCHLLWLRGYSAPAATLDLNALATDSSDNIVAGGALKGDIDLGLGTLHSALGCALIARWDAAGNLSWNRCIDSKYDTSIAHDVLFDAADAVVVTGTVGSDADFGSGRLQATSGASLTYLARYSGQGKPLWSKNLGTVCADSQVSWSPSATIVHKRSDFIANSTSPAALVISEYDVQGRLLATSRAAATYSSEHPELEIDPELNWVLIWPYADHTSTGNLPSALLERFSADGVSLWKRALHASGGFWPIDLQLDIHNNSIVAAQFNGRLEMESVHLTSQHADGGDIYLEKRDRDGKLLRADQLSRRGPTTPLALAVDTHDVTFIVGFEADPVQNGGHYTLFISKWP